MTDNQPDDDDDSGASPFQQLLYAAKTDSVELCESCLSHSKLGDDEVNKMDGLGMTALHYAVKSISTEVIELLLDNERTDVDPVNKLDGDTPLHLAVKIADEEPRNWMCRTLLEAGADPRIQNKYKDKPVDLLPKDSELREDFRKAEAEMAIDASDVVKDDDSDVDGEEGGNSGEE